MLNHMKQRTLKQIQNSNTKQNSLDLLAHSYGAMEDHPRHHKHHQPSLDNQEQDAEMPRNG